MRNLFTLNTDAALECIRQGKKQLVVFVAAATFKFWQRLGQPAYK